MDWMFHHINLPAVNVQETRTFLRDVIGLQVGHWIYPDRPGELHHDDDSIAYFGRANRGLHVVRSIVSFARDNGFMHNPTVGGHIALSVPDLEVVKARLDEAGTPYSDAGVYAMSGVHQIYVYDPSFNVIEINQTVTPLPSEKLDQQDLRAEIQLRHAAITVLDLASSITFYRDLLGLGEPTVNSRSAIFRNNGLAMCLTCLTSGYADDNATAPTSRDPYFTLAFSDIEPVKERLDRAEIPNSGIVSDPIDGRESLFVYAPSMRLMAVVGS
ncbi:MAG: hypothetical protein AAGA73_01825 [Pseudomonadota bacterium]